MTILIDVLAIIGGIYLIVTLLAGLFLWWANKSTQSLPDIESPWETETPWAGPVRVPEWLLSEPSVSRMIKVERTD